jgi:DNA-directed RNA polymerase specialized sigma24 family protein
MKGRATEPQPLHRILREVLRHYSEFRSLVSATGKHVIEHSVPIWDEAGENIVDRQTVTISFWDLHRGIKDLSPRKREALWYNVILDWRQRDVAERMGITTVSVGQYVEQAVMQLAETYFADEEQPKDELQQVEE